MSAKRRLLRVFSGVVPGVMVLLATAGPAFAVTKVAVLGVEPVKAPVNIAARFSAALKEHVKRTAGYELVPGKAIEEVKLVFGCGNESPGCMAKVGESLKAERLFWGTLSRSTKGYLLRLVVLRVSNGSIERQLRQHFSADELRDPETRVLRLANRILPPVGSVLTLRCGVEGTNVYIDGRRKGQIQGGQLAVRGLAPGPHVVRLNKVGFAASHQQVTLVAGSDKALTVVLIPEKAGTAQAGKTLPATGSGKSGTARLGWKVAFFSSVVATVGIGVGLIVNGLRVYDLEDQKNDAFESFPGDPLLKTTDVCTAVAGMEKYSAITDICDSGDTRALVQNILVGVIGLTGALSVYFGYKAFIATADEAIDGPLDGADEKRTARSSSWQVVPGVGQAGMLLRYRF